MVEGGCSDVVSFQESMCVGSFSSRTCCPYRCWLMCFLFVVGHPSSRIKLLFVETLMDVPISVAAKESVIWGDCNSIGSFALHEVVIVT